MISYRRLPSGIVEIRAGGRIHRNDIDEIWRRIDADVGSEEKLRVLEIVEGYEGIDLAAIWEDLRVSLPRIRQVSRAAVVADEKWIERAVSLSAHFIPAQTRFFHSRDVDKAMAWLEAE